jgi:hypothetical protein
MELTDSQKRALRNAYNLGGYTLLLKECGIHVNELGNERPIAIGMIEGDRFPPSIREEIFYLAKKTFYLNELKVNEFENAVGL